MVLSNAERQARFRERKKAEALERIARYEAMRDKALAWIKDIDAGQRHYSAIGDQPWRDYTDELREEKVREAAMYEEFINLWRRDAGHSASDMPA